MNVRLLDYKDSEFFVDIPDDTESITIKVITGDMVMTDPIHFDTSNHRLVNFNDGIVTLKRDQFHYLDEVRNSYELFNINKVMLSELLEKKFSSVNVNDLLKTFETELNLALQERLPFENMLTATFKYDCNLFENTVENYLNKKYPAYQFTVSNSNKYWSVCIIKK